MIPPHDGAHGAVPGDRGAPAGGGRSRPSAPDARSRPLRVALVNDYDIIVHGLHAMLAPFADRIVVVEHETRGIPQEHVDIALFDTFAGRKDAVARAAEMVESGNARHVVLYTWDASAEFLEAVRSIGASAVLLKSVDGADLVHALERIAAGERLGLDHVTRSQGSEQADSLSMREREVLAMLALGSSNSDIASELYLSVDTVKTYVRRVFQKLGVHNRTQAAMMAQRYGLAPPASRLERTRSGPGSA